jgi:hypothetical protein
MSDIDSDQETWGSQNWAPIVFTVYPPERVNIPELDSDETEERTIEGEEEEEVDIDFQNDDDGYPIILIGGFLSDSPFDE